MSALLLAFSIAVETAMADGQVHVDRIEAVETEGMVRFVWPKERIPAEAKTLTVTPDFATARPPSMGTVDLEATTDGKLRQAVAWMKEGYDEYARRRDLQYCFMNRHEKVAEDLFRVTYSNGARMYCNYGAQQATVGGTAVPALGYAIVK